MSKRKADEDEDVAEMELAAAIKAAAEAPADEEIGGLGDGTAMVHYEVVGECPPQYKPGRQKGEKYLVLIYLCIRGLGETPRMMLAEVGASYTHLASPMGEDQAVSCEWRKRSPNGLTPMLSGLGVPRSQPLSQSGTIIRYLAGRYGMAGESELDVARADCLYQTVKDLGAKKSEIIEVADAPTEGAKGPSVTAATIGAMREAMPDPSDAAAALNYGQIELLNLLLDLEEQAAGCVKALSPALDAFRAAGAARPRIAKYLASPLRFPAIVPGYRYKAGPVKRASFKL